jgi:hypothetical protein
VQATEVLVRAEGSLMCSGQKHTLAFFVLLHVFLCKAELLTLVDVQIDLMPDVCDDGRALDAVRMS